LIVNGDVFVPALQVAVLLPGGQCQQIDRVIRARASKESLIGFSPVTPFLREASVERCCRCFPITPLKVYFLLFAFREVAMHSQGFYAYGLAPCIPGGLLFFS